MKRLIMFSALLLYTIIACGQEKGGYSYSLKTERFFSAFQNFTCNNVRFKNANKKEALIIGVKGQSTVDRDEVEFWLYKDSLFGNNYFCTKKSYLADFANITYQPNGSQDYYFALSLFDSLRNTSNRHMPFYINISDTVRSLVMNEVDIDNSGIFSTTEMNTAIYYTHQKELEFVLEDTASTASFSRNKIDKISFKESKIPSMVFYGDTIGSLHFNACVFQKPLSFNGLLLPDKIEMDGCTNFGHNSIDLRTFSFVPGKECLLMLSAKTDIESLLLNYENFRLQFDSSTNANKDELRVYKEHVYKVLLEQQKLAGNLAGYEKLDKEYHAWLFRRRGFLGSVLNVLNKWWWDYGYDNSLIIWRSFELLFIIMLINLFLYPRILYHGYTLEEFKRADQVLLNKYGLSKKKLPYRVIYCFIYTSYIFWGLKLEIEKVKIQNLGFAFWIFLQYCIGLFCLAWIAGVLILK